MSAWDNTEFVVWIYSLENRKQRYVMKVSLDMFLHDKARGKEILFLMWQFCQPYFRDILETVFTFKTKQRMLNLKSTNLRQR